MLVGANFWDTETGSLEESGSNPGSLAECARLVQDIPSLPFDNIKGYIKTNPFSKFAVSLAWERFVLGG